MDGIVLGATLIAAVFDWIAARNEIRWLISIFKPATLILLIAWFYLVTGFQGLALWLGIGLVFSLVGDVFFMLSAKFFIPGVMAFLVAHLLYAAGFSPGLPPFSPWFVAIALAVLLAAVLVNRRVTPALALRPHGAALGWAIRVYSFAISLMLISALLTLTRPSWSLTAAVTVSCGAILYAVSDSLLIFDRFVRPIRHGRFYVHATYHLGQIVLMLGAVQYLQS